MECIKCKKKVEKIVPSLKVCFSCFPKIIERRVRKDIRINELFKEKDKVLIIDDGSPESKISIYLLNEIIKDPTIKIRTKKLDYKLGEKVKGKFNKIIIPWNADKESEYFLSSVLECKKARYLGNYKIKKKIYLKLLLHVLHEEAELFCRFKKIEFSDSVNKESLANILINGIRKEYPEILFGLIKSSEKTKKV